jgi:hypothetical protein
MGTEVKRAIELRDTDQAAKLLKEAKADLGHTHYTPWLWQHGISERTAQRILKLKNDTF